MPGSIKPKVDWRLPRIMRKHFIGLGCTILIGIAVFYQASFVRSATDTLHRSGNPQPSKFVVSSHPNEVDLTRLPLGDGKLSNAPKVGWIWACRVDPHAGGAFRNGPWIKADGTYNFKAKTVVDGAVTWPYRFQMALRGNQRIFTTNDLPNHPTGRYPISETDDAFLYDRNPATIAKQTMQVALPTDPKLAAQPTCVPGAIGILVTGAVLFNALDAPGRDAVAHESQDSCQGHPQESGVYHYHSATTCLPDKMTGEGHSILVGYALDGFGIYGRHGEGGRLLTSANLDACHGHTHAIDWDGKQVSMYHYHATWDFPYTVGCMRGMYKMSDVTVISGPAPMLRGRPVFPPPSFGTAPPQHRPDMGVAARKLGISERELREALGPPPPNLGTAAGRLGISEQMLRDALGVP
jgi:YHYH protein